MHKSLTSVVALAGLAAAGTAQAEQADAVIAGDADQPMLLTSTQMDTVTAGSAGGSWFVEGDAIVEVFGFSDNIPGFYAASSLTAFTTCFGGGCLTGTSVFAVVDGY